MNETSFVQHILSLVGNYGPLGVITAYLLYNDYQDRKVHRKYLTELGEKVNDHELRLTLLERDRDE